MEDAAVPTISSFLPDLIDSYIATRARRLDAEKQAEAIKEQEDELSKTIIAKMREGGMKAMGANLGLIKLQETEEPVAENWPELWKFIKDTDSWDLLHKRVTVTAVRDRWEEGVAVPGVGKITKYKLSVSKL
jgi:hypothetical protein